MPFLDRIIQFLQTEQGNHILLESNQNAVIYRAGGRAETQHRLTDPQIRALVAEILPGQHRLAFARGDAFSFDYPYAAGPVPVEVTQVPGIIRVKVVAPGTQAEPEAAAASA